MRGIQGPAETPGFLYLRIARQSVWLRQALKEENCISGFGFPVAVLMPMLFQVFDVLRNPVAFMSDLYLRTFTAMQRAWPWVAAVILVSLMPLLLGNWLVAGKMQEIDTGPLFALMNFSTVLRVILWIVLGFALHLVVLMQEGRNGVWQNRAVLWPFAWRLIVTGVIYLLGSVPFMFLAFPIFYGMSSEMFAGTGGFIALMFAVSLGAILIKGGISIFVGTWFPAAIFGRFATLSDSFDRGRAHFGMTASLLLKGPFVFAVLSYGLNYAFGPALPINATSRGFVLSLFDTLVTIVIYSMTTVIFCEIYQHSLTNRVGHQTE